MGVPPLEAEWALEVRDVDGAPSDTCRLMDPGTPLTVDLEQAPSRPATATVTVPAALAGSACGDCQPLPWLDEIVLTRADQVEPHFVGPVTFWRADPDGTLTITARDRSIWAYRGRVLASTVAYDPAGIAVPVDAHDLFDRYWADSEKQNPTGLRLMRHSPGPFPTSPVALGGEALGAKLDELSDRAIDWAVVGLHLFYGAPEMNLPDPGVLDDASFDPAGLAVSVDGDSVVDQVTGRGEGDTTFTWPAEAKRGDWGYHWAEYDAGTAATPAETEAAVKRVVAAHARPAVAVEPGDAGLSRFCPIDPTELLPGRLVRLVARLYGTTIEQTSRVAGLTWRLEGGLISSGRWALAERQVKPTWTSPGVRA